MGKNKRRTISVRDEIHQKDLEVDSQEEQEFVRWLNEAVRLGIVGDFEYQPPPIQLSPSVKYQDFKTGKTKVLFREHVYTADFILYVDPKISPNIVCELKKDDPIKKKGDLEAFYIDIKGGFMSNGSDRSFPMNQKWVYAKYGIYVHKLVPKDFFLKFGIIEDFKYTAKTKKPSKRYAGYPTIEEVVSAKGN